MVLSEIPPVVPLLPTTNMTSSSGQLEEGLAGGPDLTNWMSLLLPRQDMVKQPRVFIGDGFPTIPKRLQEKLLHWEFVDFADLRAPVSAETLNADLDSQKLIVLPGLKVSKAKKKAVQDIRVWLQCSALYVAVLARKFPDTVPDLMAYQLLTHWDYEDPAWQRYDEAFRDKAAATGNRKWSSLDPHLFNKICAGRARKVGLDASALPVARGAWDSPQGPPLKIPAREMGRPWGGKAFQPRNFRSNMCWDWNQGACKYNPCEYHHICSECGGRHPHAMQPK